MRKVIYTVNLGGYDSFKEPSIVTPGWEYHYLTDQDFKSNIWEVTNIGKGDVRTSRRLKIVSPYRHADIYIWIDSSIQINCNLDDFINQYCNQDFNLLRHPHRDCIYEEARACIKRYKDSPNVINSQISSYLKLKYPPHNGMVATGLIVRKKNPKIDSFCEKWYKEVEKYSKRDQLSFNFIAHYNPIQYNLIPFEVLKKEFVLHKHIK